MEDVVMALKARDVAYWVDEPAIKRMIEGRVSGQRVPVAKAKDGEVLITVENGEKEVYMVLEPAYGGREMTREDVDRAIAKKMVRKGIDEEAIERALSQGLYGRRVLVASYKEPVHGQDAVIQFLFQDQVGDQPQRGRR